MSCNGEMTLYAAQRDPDGRLISVEKRDIAEGAAEVLIPLDGSCAEITLYAWNRALSPLSVPVTVRV